MKTVKIYKYVGPEDIREQVLAAPNIRELAGPQIKSPEGLREWLENAGQSEKDEVTCTFVIDLRGFLRIADRRSEHVACAGGLPVLSAGEITFAQSQDGWEVASVTNQSTGYCPERRSWSSVVAAFQKAGLAHPDSWTEELIFRRCTSCSERNIVKDDQFICDVCGADLPPEWNFW